MYFVNTYLVRPKLPLISLGVVVGQFIIPSSVEVLCMYFLYIFGLQAKIRHISGLSPQLIKLLLGPAARALGGPMSAPPQTLENVDSSVPSTCTAPFRDAFPPLRHQLHAISRCSMRDWLPFRLYQYARCWRTPYLFGLTLSGSCQAPARFCRQNSWSTRAPKMPSPHQQHTTSW